LPTKWRSKISKTCVLNIAFNGDVQPRRISNFGLAVQSSSLSKRGAVENYFALLKEISLDDEEVAERLGQVWMNAGLDLQSFSNCWDNYKTLYYNNASLKNREERVKRLSFKLSMGHRVDTCGLEETKRFLGALKGRMVLEDG
jgi:hypothetical protein